MEPQNSSRLRKPLRMHVAKYSDDNPYNRPTSSRTPQQKTIVKFKEMHPFITFTKRDAREYHMDTCEIVGNCLLLGSIAYFLSARVFLALHRHTITRLISTAGTFTLGVYIINQRVKQLQLSSAYKFLEKYRVQAILHGFRDYQIK